MTQLRALIFDMDGTLADTEEIHRLAFNAAFYDFGLDWEWTPELYEELLAISGGRERIAQYTAQKGLYHDRGTLLDFARDVHRVKTGHYARMLVAGRITLRIGVRRLLREAREHDLRMAIATSSAYSNVKTLLDINLGAGWRPWFEVIATCNIIEDKKPSPAVYHYVLKEMDLRPSECLAFEDTVNGMRAATGAGIKSIITTHYFTRNHKFPDAALVINHLGEPDHPFKRIAGRETDANFVSIPLLEEIAQSSSQTDRNTRIRAVGATSAMGLEQ